MRKIFKILVFGMFFAGGGIAHAQTLKVTGIVTSLEDGLPLPGASIVIEGTSIGVASDIDGKYTIELTQGAKQLTVSSIGYISQTVDIGARKVINFVLAVSTETIDEVMVVAYGSTKKSAFTGSATQINSSKIETRPISNISQALEGATSGVQVTSASGAPGSSQSIRIRGIGSINASSSPLYVIDGSPSSFSISNLNPDDIESITVLKDAASSALYGSKAANGVVLITTKKGKLGDSKFDVKFSQGLVNRSMNEYERVDAYGYYPLMWEALRSVLATNKSVKFSYPLDGSALDQVKLDKISELASKDLFERSALNGFNVFNVPDEEVVGPDGKINPNAQYLPNMKGDLDWFKPLERTGHRTNLSVSYSGATKKTNYHISTGYTNDQGFIINSDFERFTGRMNVNSEIKKWFKTGLSLNGTLSKSNGINTSSNTGYINPFYFARSIGPIFPIYEHNMKTGDFLLDEYGQKIYSSSRIAGAMSGRHILQEITLNKTIHERNMVGARNYYDIIFMDGLKFSAHFNVDLYNYRYSDFDNRFVGDGAPAGRAKKTSSLTTDVTLLQTISYAKEFGVHGIDIILGHENNANNYKYFTGSKQNVIVDGNIELLNFTTTNELESYVSNYRSEGYFSRFNYSYDNKYNLSASFRRDGSSKFYKDVRWGNFWSIGGAWLMHKEDFVRNIAFINFLKLRLSYGQVGNDSGINLYAWQALYSLGQNNGPEAGTLQSSLLSKNLVWESNSSFDFGLDFGLFNRVNGTIGFFNRQSSNLLFDVPLPLSSGLTSVDKNIGTMFNRGVELELSIDPIKREEFRWKVELNATHFVNRITKMPNGKDDEIISGTKKLKEGHSVYDYWLRQWYGVDERDGVALYYADSEDYAKNPTSSQFRIIGSDTLTSNHNYAKYDYSGSSIPWVMGSFSNTLSYKGFDLSFMFTFQIGGKVYDGTYAGLMHTGRYGRALHVDALKRWQKPGDKTDVPRMDASSRTRSSAGAASTRWLIDASYLNMRSVTLAYNIPSHLMKKLDLSVAKVYVSGENLFTLSKRKGTNMQQAFSGVTSNDYVPARIITFGINVSF